jgi:hypothetical protein
VIRFKPRNVPYGVIADVESDALFRICDIDQSLWLDQLNHTELDSTVSIFSPIKTGPLRVLQAPVAKRIAVLLIHQISVR